jgi:ferrochelatase
MNITRAPSLNDSPTFARSLADLASEHLKAVAEGKQGPTSVQMALRCPGCTNERCKESKAFFSRGGRDLASA